MWAHDHQDRPTMTEVVKTLEELVGIRWKNKTRPWHFQSYSYISMTLNLKFNLTV
jgi:hypothetical protein